MAWISQLQVFSFPSLTCPSVNFNPWPNQDLHIPLGLLSGVDQPAASVLLSFSKLPNMGRSTFYKSPSTKLRNQRRLTSYLKGKVLTSLVVPAQIPKSRKTQLTKSSVSQTSYPEPCIVCSKHQCEWDFHHYISYPVIEAINAKFDSVMERPFWKCSETPPD